MLELLESSRVLAALKKSGNHQDEEAQEETDAPPIGERSLTLREAADVLRLSTHTVREYVQRGDIEGRIIVGAFFANAPRSWDFAGKRNQGD